MYAYRRGCVRQILVSDRLGSQSTMEGVLHECTGVEQRAVVRFLWAKGLSTEEVNREIRPVYGDTCFSRKTVLN